MLWENSEEQLEGGEIDKAVSKNGHHIINNFSLSATESADGKLEHVLRQWLEWQ